MRLKLACPEILRPRGSSRPARKKSSCRAEGIRSGTRLSQLAISNPTTTLTPSGGEAQVIAFGVEQNAASFSECCIFQAPQAIMNQNLCKCIQIILTFLALTLLSFK
jgi:hypothetical protein